MTQRPTGIYVYTDPTNPPPIPFYKEPIPQVSGGGVGQDQEWLISHMVHADGRPRLSMVSMGGRLKRMELSMGSVFVKTGQHWVGMELEWNQISAGRNWLGSLSEQRYDLSCAMLGFIFASVDSLYEIQCQWVRLNPKYFTRSKSSSVGLVFGCR